MKLDANKAVSIFQNSVLDWHKAQKPSENPFPENTLEHTLYQKNQIDTIQWHIEDDIRVPNLALEEVVVLKRRIDKLNQERTDMVERLDDFILELFRDIQPKPGARLNSESPAWLLDRMSILELKIFHMQEQVDRTDSAATSQHIETCKKKLSVLLEQRADLKICLDELLEDYAKGDKKMKVYRQMKMYNDQNLNPSLYNAKK
ncbi:hypothetical protein LPTSP4_14110 [Leptospira ryugenii]|uniref:PF14063 family protein n=1 Tax=Leptospira ryugenii TaxID=1917863 RepID=A0A2P2DZ31_9LEPT|nr:DUF4254 domain-containing protein [Leptospira ryugenii]GBF49891.1 hypothetical protein LPTSP4_14110 [Leptospira ryugenii]